MSSVNNKIFQDFLDKIIGIEDLVELADVFTKSFSGGGSCFNFLIKNRSNLISKAYIHDYENWASNLNYLSQCGIGGKDGFTQEDLDEGFFTLDFYKAAIGLLAYLESDFNPYFDLTFDSGNLEKLLFFEDYRVSVILPNKLPDEIKFSHFYIIWNLAKNAYSAIFDELSGLEDESRVIELGYGFSPALTSISVIDSGPGVPMTKLRRIFREGFTSKAISSNKGFGLYGIKQIIDKRGGQVGVMTRHDNYMYHFFDYPRPDGKKPKIWRDNDNSPLIQPEINTLFQVLLPNK